MDIAPKTADIAAHPPSHFFPGVTSEAADEPLAQSVEVRAPGDTSHHRSAVCIALPACSAPCWCWLLRVLVSPAPHPTPPLMIDP